MLLSMDVRSLISVVRCVCGGGGIAVMGAYCCGGGGGDFVVGVYCCGKM